MFNQPRLWETRRTLGRYLVRLALALGTLAPMLLTGVPTVQADTEVGGPIISDTTWTLANSPYIVVESIDVWEGVTLAIEPGVTVKFDSGKKLQVNGELIAQGTAGNLVTFTSNQPDPAPGDWGNIEFTSTAITTTMGTEGNYVSGSILQYCVVEYAGYGASSAIETHSLLIDHCTVRDNDARAIYATYSTVSGNTVNGNQTGGGSYTGGGGGIYATYTTVSGNTVSGNSAGGGGGIYATHSIVSGNTLSGNSASDGGGISASSSTVISNTISGNWGQYGGGILAADSTVGGNTVSDNSGQHGGGINASSTTVTGNTISGNSASGGGGGIHAWSSTVNDNTVSGNSASNGGGISAAHSTVLTNTITANSANSRGAGVYVAGSSDFLYNTVVGNTGPAGSTIGGVAIEDTPQVHYNNLYGNEPYDVTVVSSDDISGTHNYWGIVSSVDILAQVYDWYDDSSRGKFLYVPYLQDPSPDAPFPPPIGLTTDFQDSSVTLSWDAHPSFTTGWGYKVYYDTDSSLPPYEGTGLNEGDSPIDVGNQTTYTLTDLDPSKDYYFAVTAYDNEGHESWYSNVEWRQGGYWVYLPVVLKDH